MRSKAHQFIFGVVMILGVLGRLMMLAPRSLVRADFDRDGRLDLAIVDERDSAVSVFLSTPDGGFVFHGKFCVGGFPRFVVAGDFDGDAAIDLATANALDGTVSILLNKSDGTFQRPHNYVSGIPAPSSLIADDFNGDGRLDLEFWDYLGRKMAVLLGNGDGTF